MKQNWKIAFLVVFLIIIASFFRLYNIKETPPGLYPDEAMNGNNALEAINATVDEDGYKVFYPENNGREGMFINIQAFFLKLFLKYNENPEPWMLRFTSALFGIFTVFGIYFLVNELFGKNKESKSLAIISMFLISTSFWHINFSRIGFRAIMAPFFLVWGIFFLIYTFRKNSEQNENISKLKKVALPLFAGFVYGLGMHSYIAYRATPLIIFFILCFFIQKYGLKNVFKIGGLFTIGAIIASTPLIFYFIEHPQDFFGRTTQVSILNSASPIKEGLVNIAKTIGMLFWHGDTNWRHNLSGKPELLWPVAILFAVGIFAGIKKIFTKNVDDKKIGIKILFVWIIVAILPVIITNEGIPHALRSILMIPPVLVIAGYGCFLIYEWLLKKNVKKTLISIAGIMLFLLIVISTYTNYFIIWGKNSETDMAFTKQFVDIGNTLNSLPRELPKYAIVSSGGVDVRGMPMPTQTTMFITDTFLEKKQNEKNIFYIKESEKEKIAPGAFVTEIK